LYYRRHPREVVLPRKRQQEVVRLHRIPQEVAAPRCAVVWPRHRPQEVAVSRRRRQEVVVPRRAAVRPRCCPQEAVVPHRRPRDVLAPRRTVVVEYLVVGRDGDVACDDVAVSLLATEVLAMTEALVAMVLAPCCDAVPLRRRRQEIAVPRRWRQEVEYLVVDRDGDVGRDDVGRVAGGRGGVGCDALQRWEDHPSESG
jgi:hypothetical protein